MMWIRTWKNVANSQNSVRGTFSFSNCHIIGSDTGSQTVIQYSGPLSQTPQDIKSIKSKDTTIFNPLIVNFSFPLSECYLFISHVIFIIFESHINFKIVHYVAPVNSFRISFGILSKRISTIEI
jgi:hypothetical protein